MKRIVEIIKENKRNSNYTRKYLPSSNSWIDNKKYIK